MDTFILRLCSSVLKKKNNLSRVGSNLKINVCTVYVHCTVYTCYVLALGSIAERVAPPSSPELVVAEIRPR